jgi:peptidoglycan/LPS O-acetylase OafA/YrhL
MIQRIQTVYLAIAFALAGLMFIPAFHSFMQGYAIYWQIAVYAGWGLSAILSLIAIFQFRKRNYQTRSSLLSMLFVVLPYAVIVPLSQSGDYSLPVAFPLIAFILLILAVVAIRKDEKLVRSADRLR